MTLIPFLVTFIGGAIVGSSIVTVMFLEPLSQSHRARGQEIRHLCRVLGKRNRKSARQHRALSAQKRLAFYEKARVTF